MNNCELIAIWVGCFLGIVITCVMYGILELGGMASDIWVKLNDVRERCVRLRIDRDLAKHGLTNDMVIDALNKLYEFRFFLDGRECVARKGPDGEHQFVFVGEDKSAPEPSKTLNV
ncbi:hypothetical protein R5W24_000552 [Gemmata sp. JC717]|uniref:hypothetical protein n=1 Tax=Gemmata algarum TaxID=2975278 RepID=UPI0021BB4DE7|nr:hypothetical protein [Gemmata algarum]MDY3551476.1 hypothetical protein [Gemmata algarum]